MREYTTISVPPELLPQVLRQLLALAADPNYVDVTDGPSGRIIRVHPDIAEVWYNELLSTPKAEEPAPEPVQEPESNVEDDNAQAPQPAPAPQSAFAPQLTELQINGTDVPVKRGRGRPRKVAFSASNGEES